MKSFTEVPLAHRYLVQVGQGGTALASMKVSRSQALDLTFRAERRRGSLRDPDPHIVDRCDSVSFFHLLS